MSVRWKPWKRGALGVLALSACTSSASPGATPTVESSHAAVASSAAPSPVKSAPTPSASAKTEPSSPNDSRKGNVSFSRTGTPDGSYAPVAGFFEELGIPPTCEHRQVGVCSIETCNLPVPRHGGIVRRPSAGVLDVTVAGKLGHLEPWGKGNEQTYFAGAISEPPVGGELVEVHAHGAPSGVPAFEGSVRVPKGIRLVAPKLGKYPNPFVVQQGADLPYAWEPATTGQFRVTITNGPTSTLGTKSVTCVFPARAHAGVVPADVVAELRPGPAMHVYGVSDRVEVLAGSYTVTISADAPVLPSARGESSMATIKAAQR